MTRSFLRSLRFGSVPLLAARLAPLAVLALAGSAHAGDTQSYTTVPGDTCEGLAAKFWGDPKAYPKLHELNPQMGPVPHHIKPGTVLEVAKPGPDAKVTFVRNHVEAATPDVHPAANGEPLSKGNKVDTFEKSNAEVTFKDDSRLQLAEQTLVIILGSTFSKATFGKTAEDTTLVKGNLAAFLAGSSSKKVTTPSGKITLGGGEAKIGVDAKEATRLAVYKGKSTLSNAGKSVDVKEGFGSKSEKGKAPTPPRPLPTAPTWAKALPPLSLTTAGEVDLSGTFAPGAGGPKVVAWHVQLSRDAAFNDLVIDAQRGGGSTTFDAPKLAAGHYFARVSGIDDDFFEGPWGAVTTFDVATTTIVPAAPGKGASLKISPGVFCGLDGGPLAATTDAGLALTPLSAHVVRCALDATGTGASEVSISAEQSGLATATTALSEPTFDGDQGRRDVRVTLLDPTGAPVVGAKVEAKSSAFSVDPAKAEAGGVYVATVHWKSAAIAGTSGKVQFVVNGVQTIDVEVPAASPTTDAKTEPPPAPTALKPFRVEVGIVGLAQLPTDTLGGGGGVGLDVGGRFLVGNGALTVGLRPMYERHLAGSSHETACSSDAPSDSACRFGAASYHSAMESDLFSLGLPITYRLKNETSWWTPYVGVVPQLQFDRVKEVVDAGLGPSGQLVGGQNDASYATRFALATLLGVQLSPGGRGAFFLEIGWRFAARREVSGVDAAPKGLLGFLGYRFAL